MLFFLQTLDAQDPSLHDLGTLASALDQIGDVLLIVGDLLADRLIKGRRHLVALFGVIHHKNAIDRQRVAAGPCELVVLLQQFDKILERL